MKQLRTIFQPGHNCCHRIKNKKTFILSDSVIVRVSFSLFLVSVMWSYPGFTLPCLCNAQMMMTHFCWITSIFFFFYIHDDAWVSVWEKDISPKRKFPQPVDQMNQYFQFVSNLRDCINPPRSDTTRQHYLFCPKCRATMGLSKTSLKNLWIKRLRKRKQALIVF